MPAATTPPLAHPLAPPLAPLANALAASPCGRYLAYLGEPDVLCLYGVVEGEAGGAPAGLTLIDSLTLGPADDLCAAAWAPMPPSSPPLLAVATRGGVALFRASAGGLVRAGAARLPFWPRGLAASAHPTEPGAWLLAVAGSPGVVVFEVRAEGEGDTPSPPSPLTITRARSLGAPWPAVATALTLDGALLAGAGAAGQLWVWRLAEKGEEGGDAPSSLRAPTPELHAQVPAERVTGLAFARGGATLAAAAWGGGVWLWRRAADDAPHPPCPPAGAPAPALLAVEPSAAAGGAPASRWALAGAAPARAPRGALCPSDAPATLLAWVGPGRILLARCGGRLEAVDVAGDGALAVAWGGEGEGGAAAAPAEAPPVAPLASSLPLPPRATDAEAAPARARRASAPRGLRGLAPAPGGRCVWCCDSSGGCSLVAGVDGH